MKELQPIKCAVFNKKLWFASSALILLRFSIRTERNIEIDLLGEKYMQIRIVKFPYDEFSQSHRKAKRANS